MKKYILTIILAVVATSIMAQGYQVGDIATDFKLKNIDGKMVSMSDYKDAKGFIITFTCNHCPYSVAYEDRLVELDKKYKTKGYPVLAINPNDAVAYPADSYDNMKKRAKEKGFTFPYLHDESQEIAKAYGATRTPHMYIVQKTSKGMEVVYIGAIDNDTDNKNPNKEKYVEAAVNDLLAGKKPANNFTKAVGCTIKWKKQAN